MKKIQFNKFEISKTPRNNGIYIFYDTSNYIIYIGKASDLRNRLSSYKLTTVIGKTLELVKRIRYFSYIEVGSEIEALLLETKLIKKYKPKYNIQLKDDKNFLYIRIVKNKFPRITTARRVDKTNEDDDFYGPFPSSSNVRSVLRILRKIFPYAQHETIQGKPCFYNQIRLCDPCPNKIDPDKDKDLVRRYGYNIKMIKGILNGRFEFVKLDLQKKMTYFAKKEKYEEAKEMKNKLDILNYITQPQINPNSFVKDPNFLQDVRSKELDELIKLINIYMNTSNLTRIECFDIAHLQGSEPTASMVTFIDGEPEKDLYRRFKIKQNKGNDDIASLTEVAKRRERHFTDWGIPDLIIVDGGKGQVKAFKEVFLKHNIPVIGLAKRFESLVIPLQGTNIKYIVKKVPKGNALNLLQRLRDEAHRFARSYHHKLLEKILISEA